MTFYNLTKREEEKMEYIVKTLLLRQKVEEMDNNDRDLTEKLNQFALKGYHLEKIIPDERLSPTGEGKKVYLLVFKK